MYFPVIQLTGDSKNKSVANRKWISQEYTFFVFICRQQYFLRVFFWTLSQLFCSNSSQTGSQFDLSCFQTPLTFIQTKDQKTLWFTFPRQAKFICSTSTVFYFFFSSIGLKWTTGTVDTSVIIIVSCVTKLWCKDLKPTTNKAREGLGSITKTHLCNWIWWRGGVITDAVVVSLHNVLALSTYMLHKNRLI